MNTSLPDISFPLALRAGLFFSPFLQATFSPMLGSRSFAVPSCIVSIHSPISLLRCMCPPVFLSRLILPEFTRPLGIHYLRGDAATFCVLDLSALVEPFESPHLQCRSDFFSASFSFVSSGMAGFYGLYSTRTIPVPDIRCGSATS